MRSLKVGVLKVWLFVGLLAMTLAGGGLMLAGGPGDPGDKKGEPAEGGREARAAKAGRCGRRTTRSSTRAACPCRWRSRRTGRRCSPATRTAKSWP